MPKILLVEDNEMNRDMLSRRLVRNGFEVVIAVDGQQGLAMATSESPDVILMDMSLPVMDGWEATRRVKADPATKSIPVIALTANALVEDRERAMAAGCDDFDTKPVELPRLLEKSVRIWTAKAAPPRRRRRLPRRCLSGLEAAPALLLRCLPRGIAGVAGGLLLSFQLGVCICVHLGPGGRFSRSMLGSEALGFARRFSGDRRLPREFCLMLAPRDFALRVAFGPGRGDSFALAALLDRFRAVGIGVLLELGEEVLLGLAREAETVLE